jgi:hypothetical protein
VLKKKVLFFTISLTAFGSEIRKGNDYHQQKVPELSMDFLLLKGVLAQNLMII